MGSRSAYVIRHWTLPPRLLARPGCHFLRNQFPVLRGMPLLRNLGVENGKVVFRSDFRQGPLDVRLKYKVVF